MKDPWWRPDPMEAANLSLAGAHLAKAKEELQRAYAAAATHGDASGIGYWREQCRCWQDAVDALTLSQRK